jgi:hypothetical protein
VGIRARESVMRRGGGWAWGGGWLSVLGLVVEIRETPGGGRGQVAAKGKSPRGRCWTRSADDGLRAGDAQPLARKPDPICPARAAIRPLISDQRAVEKRGFQRPFGRRSDAKMRDLSHRAPLALSGQPRLSPEIPPNLSHARPSEPAKADMVSLRVTGDFRT